MSYPELKTLFPKVANYNAIKRTGITTLEDLAQTYRWDPITGYVPIRNFRDVGWSKVRSILIEYNLIDTTTKLQFENGAFDFDSPQVIKILSADKDKLDLTPIADYFSAHAHRGTISVSDGSAPNWTRFRKRLLEKRQELVY